MHRLGLLGSAIVLAGLAGCVGGAPYAPLAVRFDGTSTVRVELLPCNGQKTDLTGITVAAIVGSDAASGPPLLERRYAGRGRAADVDLAGLSQTVGPTAHLRLTVSYTAGQGSTAFRLSYLAHPRTVLVHDRVVPLSQFRAPGTWCDGVTSLP